MALGTILWVALLGRGGPEGPKGPASISHPVAMWIERALQLHLGFFNRMRQGISYQQLQNI